jgi:formylglycine-generating enzyme required for sulfatase activity
MVTLKQLLHRTHTNYLDLLQREAKYGINKPLELVNQIRDHEEAIRLIEAALKTELTEAGLRQLKAELRPLLVASNVEQIQLDAVELETPPLPFEPSTVQIPAGPFLMGSPPGEKIPDEESPQHEVTVPAYRMGEYPVTNAEYAEFIKRNLQQTVPKKAGWFLREPPDGKLHHPVVGVSWYDARAYCRWLSEETGRTYRLPTEAEWEKAARGENGLIYPWGKAWDPGHCNQGGQDTAYVKAHPLGVSPYGCYDMVGNVQQWTSTLWGSNVQENTFPYPYQARDGREDLEADQHLHRVYRLHRGGSFRDEPSRLRCSARGYSDPDSKLRWRGFRVVLEV